MSHEKVETNIGLMAVLVLIVVSFGGLVEIVPLFFLKDTTEPITGLKPYTALQLEGRDVYIKNGCVGCHSQMIRPFRAETERYGHYSLAGEYIYDYPFLWGSKRTGPDLFRVFSRVDNEDWHRAHLINPRDVVPESNMPGFPWLEDNVLDATLTPEKMKALQMLNVPYTQADIDGATAAVEGKTEMDAVIAYLKVLGSTLKSQGGQ